MAGIAVPGFRPEPRWLSTDYALNFAPLPQRGKAPKPMASRDEFYESRRRPGYKPHPTSRPSNPRRQHTRITEAETPVAVLALLIKKVNVPESPLQSRAKPAVPGSTPVCATTFGPSTWQLEPLDEVIIENAEVNQWNI
jgi:hypothetical protein